jgi:hypothetical protein
MAKERHTVTHWRAAKRVLQYLKGTKNLSLVLGGQGALELVVHADAAYGDDQEQRKSTLGYRAALGQGLVSWKSKLSETVALSTAEAEYYAAGDAAKEGMWLTGLLGELGWEIPPFKLIMDSQSALAMIKNPVINARSKHIEVKHHFLRQLHTDKRFVLESVPSAENLADCFTKALPTQTLRLQMAGVLQESLRSGQT